MRLTYGELIRWGLVALVTLAIYVCFDGVWYAGPPANAAPAHRQQSVGVVPTSAGGPASTEQDVAALRERLDLYDKASGRIGDHVRNLTLFAGLVASVQAIFAFLASQNYESKAREMIKEVELRSKSAQAHLEKLESQILESFPLVGDLEKSVSRFLLSVERDLTSRSEQLDDIEPPDLWVNPARGTDRQRFFVLEASAISYGYFTRDDERARRLRRALGNGYSAAFTHSRESDPWTLFDRALMYFESLSSSPDEYKALTDQGRLFYTASLRSSQTARLTQARTAWLTSIERNSNQQRPYFYLGMLARKQAEEAEWRDGGKIDDWLKALEQSLEIPHWEDAPVPQMNRIVHYNYACAVYRAVEFGIPGTTVKLKLANQILRECLQDPTLLEAFRGDLEPKGDLRGLSQNDPHLHSEIQALLSANPK